MILKLFRKRRFTGEDFKELQLLYNIVAAEDYKFRQIKNNTALIMNGQKLAKQAEQIVNLLNRTRGEWIGQKLVRYGYSPTEQVNVNASTGKITVVGHAKTPEKVVDKDKVAVPKAKNA